MSTPSESSATVQPQAGLSVAEYAAAKRLPLEFMRRLGLTDVSYGGATAVRIPYLDPAGAEVSVRFRLALERTGEVDGRFRWRQGHKPRLYGLWRLPQAREASYVVLVEGESDAHTLWLHDVPALGIPGARTWREAWAADLEGIPVIYLVIEPDTGGEAVLRWLANSGIRDRVRLVRLEGVKDPSALYLADLDAFQKRWQAALDAAVPWHERQEAEARVRARAAWDGCADLARQPQILDRFLEALEQNGVAGEARVAQLLYLCVTSRLLERPVSAAVKGPSAAGKSYLTERVLDFFPATAFHALTAMSERSLAYSNEPLAHRMLVLYEAAGLQGEFASYLMRSLLSEGRVRYETVEKTQEGMRPRLIEREGPTGLLVTTTAVRLHPENETRLLSIPVCDSPEQTQQVMRAVAAGARPGVDLKPWCALQEWLESAEHRVHVPYAVALAQAVPPAGVRLRRDFSAVLNLIRAHALLHQATRDRDAEGRIIATPVDYEIVRGLLADLVADGVEAAIPTTVRETVAAVEALVGQDGAGVTVTAVAKRLGLDKSSASRRVQSALVRGHLKNLEDKRGRPVRLVLGDPLPGEVEILPARECLAEFDGCTVAMSPGGMSAPSPPPCNARNVLPPDPAPAAVCNRCGGFGFWLSRYGTWWCAGCHPPEVPELAVDRVILAHSPDEPGGTRGTGPVAEFMASVGGAA